MPLDFKNRNIAITDVETTGLDCFTHEIIEIGLVVIKQPEMEIVSTLDVKIKPINIETGAEQALKLNGYNETEWKNALSLEKAMRIYAQKTDGAIFCAYNVLFDYLFIKEAFKKTGIRNTMDYHIIDIPTFVWFKLRNSNLEAMNLNKVAAFLGIPEEPSIHRGINGAKIAFKILKKLID